MAHLAYIANIRLPTEKAHGVQIMKTCEAFAQQGIEVELIVPRRFNRIKQDLFEFYGVEKKFKITRLWCLDLISLNIFGALGFWVESWTFYLSVKIYLRKHTFSAYYTRDLPLACWFSKIVSQLYYEIHTLPDKISSIYKETWGRCAGLIVISDGLKNELTKQGVGENKILVARDAVDLKMFEDLPDKINCRQKLNLPVDKKIVVYTGHLYEWKGASVMAEAAESLSEDDNIEMYIIGGTLEDTKAFKNKYGNIVHLNIVGRRSHQQMPCWHHAADVLVVPTSAKEKIGAVYTSPMKLFEYMMAERPIVASDIPSLRELLDDTTVFFFKPDDPISLAEALKKVVANYIEAEDKASKAHELAVEKYSWEKRVKNIMGFIQIKV